MRLRRGDVVLVLFPFTSGQGGKVRPALVVQADANNERLKNTIVVMITSTTEQAHQPTQLLIDLASPAGTQSGLLHTSAVKCENLFTVEQTVILRSIGCLPAATMREVDQCLKAALELR